MPRRLLSTAAVGALLLGLAACDGTPEDPVTTPPPSIDAGNDPSDGGGAEPSDGGGEETPEPTADAPDIPPPDPADYAGMDEHTEEGAEQAFRYYIAVLYWARQTGNTGPLETLSSNNCEHCTELSSKVAADAERHDYWKNVSINESGTAHFDSTNYEIEVGYVFVVSEHTESGSEQVVPAQEWTGVAGMTWSSGSWVVNEIALEETGQ